jgi:DNA-binding response OmpR family regulator
MAHRGNNHTETDLPLSITTRRVLLAEDHIGVREIYAEILSRAGYVVDVASDGIEAWELLKGGGHQVLITDHMMPGMTGVELLRRLRRENTEMPALLVSGDMPTHESDLTTLVTPGGLLPKPFSAAQFLNLVASALRGTAVISVPSPA